MIKLSALSFLFAAGLLAQSHAAPSIPLPIPSPFETLPEQMTADQLAQAHRALVESELRETEQRLNAFAAAWNAFAVEYTGKHAVNRQKAAAVRQAWLRVENLFPARTR